LVARGIYQNGTQSHLLGLGDEHPKEDPPPCSTSHLGIKLEAGKESDRRLIAFEDFKLHLHDVSIRILEAYDAVLFDSNRDLVR